MASMYLSKLDATSRANLEADLHSAQRGNCFICGAPIDLVLHRGHIDVDHIIPLAVRGADDPTNLALTHLHCNRSKQAADLRIARELARFTRIQDRANSEGRSANLDDILAAVGGARFDLPLRIEDDRATYTFPDVGDNTLHDSQIYIDGLSGMKYFFAFLPIEYLYHDDKINPRAIGSSLKGLLEEFFRGRPQLHISLAWVATTGNGSHGCRVRVFDGQHKAAAQTLLGVRSLPVRVFVDPDPDVLLQANTNAGSVLRQVAFDKSVLRHLGSSLYADRVERYQRDHNLAPNDFSFSERDLVRYFSTEFREMKRYILDAIRDEITHHPANRLREYIDFGGRKNDRPLSYSTIEKTFFSFFIFGDVLTTPLDSQLDTGENPRELEKQQLVRLMNIVADEMLSGHFDFQRGTYQIESKVAAGDATIADSHLRVVRMCREEVIYAWLGYLSQIIETFYVMQGRPVDRTRLFQYRHPEPLWDRIASYVRNLTKLSMWVNRDLAATVFGGKQVYSYWQSVFEKGVTTAGVRVMPTGINLIEMIQS